MKWMRKIMPYIFAVMIFLCAISCNNASSVYTATPKLDTVIPPYTDTGADVLAFRINGRLVIAEDRIQRTRSITMLYLTPVDSLYPILFIESAYKSSARYEGVRISIGNVTDTGYYFLKESTETNRNQGQYLVGESSAVHAAYTTRDNRTGYVHIMKIDTVNHIIAGTFEFKAELFLLGDDTVSVTDGRFDVVYY